MKNIKLIIEYEGTNYSGWQIQDNAVTIQETIENALENLLGEKVKLIGSGRTDGRVHALGQVANFLTNSNIPGDRYKYALKQLLPPDITIIDSEEVDINRIDLSPVLSIKAKVTRVEKFPPGTRVSYGGTFITTGETKIASLPLGYADGYSRLLSGKAQVLWGEKRLPIIGRICMNQCMVDVSQVPHVKVGDEFIIIGKGKNDSISVDEIAEKLGTINYEVICMLSHRVPRIYTNLG